MHSIDRRDFISRLAGVFSVPLLATVRTLPFVKGPRLVVTHCRHMETVMDRIRDGIDMGVDESRHAAEMFGGSVEFRFISFGGGPVAGQPSPPPPPIDAVPGAIQVVIPGLISPRLWRHTVDTARSAGAIVINANARTADPYARCERHVFHVQPSPAALSAARASLPADGQGTMELWSPSLTRFGADTLNKRFTVRHGQQMDSSAWGGWFAVKCAWEAANLSQATTAGELVAFLERPGTRFDGHKGDALRFGRDHELRQPLYFVKGGQVLGEAEQLTDAPIREECT